LMAEAQAKIGLVFAHYYVVEDDTFGNSRLARNEFEGAINTQASRIVGIEDIGLATLWTIEAEDIGEAREAEL
jgi:hypothetical protein